MRRTLYAAGGAGHTAVTKEEADMLFDLNDAVILDNGCGLGTYLDQFRHDVLDVAVAVVPDFYLRIDGLCRGIHFRPTGFHKKCQQSICVQGLGH